MRRNLTDSFNALKLLIFFSLILVGSASWAHDQAGDFSDGELDQMVAPIALYPDAVLSNVLVAATYPLEVVQAALWLERHDALAANEVLEAVETEDWADAVKALVAFPELLEQMSNDPDWVQDLGDAFLQSEERLLDRVQVLRQLAAEHGTFEEMENVEIIREASNIIIQPIQREIIYVPYYDTRVVYGTWLWHDFPPVRWSWRQRHTHVYNDYYDHHGYSRGHIFWYPSVRLSSHVHLTLSLGAFRWSHRHLWVVDRHHHRHGGNQITYHHHVLRHKHARRWQHQPRHRRGVRYRTEYARTRYRTEASSTINRAVRHHERQRGHHRHNPGVVHRTAISNGRTSSVPKRYKRHERSGVSELVKRPAVANIQSAPLRQGQHTQHKIRSMQMKPQNTIQRIKKQEHQRVIRPKKRKASTEAVHPRGRSSHQRRVDVPKRHL